MGNPDGIKEKWAALQEVLEVQESVSGKGAYFSSAAKLSALQYSRRLLPRVLSWYCNRKFLGMLIAGSILVGRALQPIELAVGSWNDFVAAKGQYQM